MSTATHARDEDEVSELYRSMAVRLPANPHQFQVIACTKVDLAPDSGQTRSLAPTVLQVAPAVIAVLPGKMTEAPYVVDACIHDIVPFLGLLDVQPAPYDAQVGRLPYPLGLPYLV